MEGSQELCHEDHYNAPVQVLPHHGHISHLLYHLKVQLHLGAAVLVERRKHENWAGKTITVHQKPALWDTRLQCRRWTWKNGNQSWETNENKTEEFTCCCLHPFNSLSPCWWYWGDILFFAIFFNGCSRSIITAVRNLSMNTWRNLELVARNICANWTALVRNFCRWTFTAVATRSC